MRTLITGAGGFIGAETVRTFVSAGHEVRAHLGAPDDPVHAPPFSVETVTAAIHDQAALDAMMRNIDVCVHLAGPASVAASFEAPMEYAHAHVVGTAVVLEAMRRAGVSRLVYVSSAEVYGRPYREHVREDDAICPRSPYGAAKAAAEVLIGAAVRGKKLASAVVLRPFSVYGLRQRASSLLAIILRQIFESDAVVLDDLCPTRDYVHVNDVARAIMAASVPDTDELLTVNIASGRGTSVGDLARTALASLGRDLPIRARGATRSAATEIQHLVADVSQARVSLGWFAQIDLIEGLRRTAMLEACHE